MTALGDVFVTVVLALLGLIVLAILFMAWAFWTDQRWQCPRCGRHNAYANLCDICGKGRNE